MITPYDVTTAQDAHNAIWLKESVESPWGRSKTANYAASIVPSGFEAYARILHSAHDGRDRREISWAEAARRFGHKPHAQMQWNSIQNRDDTQDPLPEILAPATGCLSKKQANALVEILWDHTTTPQSCYFAIWDGWGSLDPRIAWADTACFQLPYRIYYLLRGGIEAAAMSVSASLWQTASIWWPEDHAWCVATEVDLMCTYVGGTYSCIAAVLSDGRLEAWRAALDDRVDVYGDAINDNP